MPLVLLCSILNLSHFSWYKDTLVLSLLVCISSLLSLLFLVYSCIFFFVFVLTRSALYVFLSYLMIIFFVLKQLCVLIVLPMSVFYLLISIFFKGSPIHKPYQLPWAPLPYLFLNFMHIFNLYQWQKNSKSIKEALTNKRKHIN